MSRLLEFILGSILITVFTVAFLFFSAVHYILRVSSIGDCSWQASARAWIDLNGDGLPDQGEPPLTDVRIHVSHLQDRLVNLSGPAMTDQEGEVQFDFSMPGCPDTLLEIYADVPEGYRLTTRPRIEVRPDFWEIPSPERVYYFGFVSDR
jgi:hypothetical protein